MRSMQYGTAGMTASRHSRIAAGLPGRLTMSELPRMPAVCRDRIAVGTDLSDTARISSPKPGKQLVAHGLGRLGRHVAPRRAGAAGGDDEATALVVAHRLQRRFDLLLLVRNDERVRLPVAGECLEQELDDGGAALVLVHAPAGPVGDGEDADFHGQWGSRLGASSSAERRKTEED